MTEEEWFASTDAIPMLRDPGVDLSDRKARLLSCASARLAWSSLIETASRQAVEVAESFADGLATEYERMVAEDQARKAEKGLSRTAAPHEQYFCAIGAKMCAIRKANAGGVCHFASGFSNDRVRLRREMAALLREIAGNPFRPVAFQPAWRTNTAVILSRQMYDSRDFGAMPILADALQDAGCEDEAILSHCRDTTLTHVRGCWVVDLVLGRQ